MDISPSALQKLTDIKGLSEAKIEKMIEAAKKLCPSHYGWQSAREVEIQVHSAIAARRK